MEFKRGKPKDDDCDRVQLCAQALCLEEMTGSEIGEGAIFYGKIRRRDEVAFDASLRSMTLEIISAFDAMMRSRKIPPPIWKKGCRSCSLIGICQPKSMTKGKLDRYKMELLG